MPNPEIDSIELILVSSEAEFFVEQHIQNPLNFASSAENFLCMFEYFLCYEKKT